MGPVLFAVFILSMLLGIPIAFAIGVASVATLPFFSSIPYLVIPQRMYASLDSFPLLAVPLFILAGNLMETGGISQRLVALANVLVGRIRGGLGLTVIVSTILFSGLSGSSNADTAAIGSVTIPAMLKKGYPPSLAAAIVAAAGGTGILIPPCINMILYGVIANTSIGALFAAGFIPGFIMGASILVLTYVKARQMGLPTEPPVACGEAGRVVLRSILPMMMPLIILGGILGGVFTATEAAGVAVLYAFVLSVLIYREIKLQDIPRILLMSCKTVGIVMLLLSMSSIFAWLLAADQIPQKLAGFMLQVSSAPWVFLLLTNIVLFVAGCFLDGAAALIILVPILAPIATKLGIDPVHYGIVVVANLGIGLITPPVGLTLYIASGIARVKLEEVVRPVLPYVLALFATLLVITYLPEVTLFLPRLMGF
ncbi:MAG: TRAP transporter large permease [Sphingomonadaceae bacterium]